MAGASRPVIATASLVCTLPRSTFVRLPNDNAFGTTTAARVVLLKVPATPPMVTVLVTVPAKLLDAVCRTCTVWPGSIVPPLPNAPPLIDT